MEYEKLIPENPVEMDVFQREERCRKTLRTVSKAIVMRLIVTGILVFGAVRFAMELWVVGLMALVMLINLAGILPLLTEWKKQRNILKNIIAEED